MKFEEEVVASRLVGPRRVVIGLKDGTSAVYEIDVDDRNRLVKM